MKITVQVDGIQGAQAALQAFSERRMNAALATALTRTAVQVRDAAQAALPKVFDRPTPYTMRSLFVRPATASRLYAIAYVKDDSATSGGGIAPTKYLLPNIEGGQRHAKRFERALQAAGHLPAGWFVTPGAYAKLDGYGNVSRGQIIQVLSQLRITQTAGYTRNMSFDPRKQITAQRKAGGRYFVIKPGTRGAAPGIYLRDSGNGASALPVFKFVRATSYKSRFDFFGIGRRVVDARLQTNVERAIAEQVQRLQSATSSPP